MAALEHPETRARVVLLARHIVGRSRLSHLRLGEPSVSAEHAMLCWNGRGWELHDLGSRNGTTLDGRRLAPGERAPIACGAVVSFGTGGPRWRLVNDGAPAMLAMPQDGAPPIVAEHDLLALPDADQPEVTVYRDATGEWVLERDGAAERTADGREIPAGGRRFTLHLPDVVDSTWDAAAVVPSLDAVALRMSVSRDEEFVSAAVLAGGRTIDLGARAHHALLLALARARLGDGHPEAALPGTSQGWLYNDDLARDLGLDEMHLNVAVYRCRQQVAGAGVAGAAGIIERRKPTRQLRLGIARVEIVTL